MLRVSSVKGICAIYFYLQTIIILYAGTSFAASSNALRWVRVYLPEFRRPGEHAQLECEYDLGNETLYAVKWYKDNEEFYRFVPKERPQTISHKVEGVRVDMTRSDSKKVMLHSVSLRTSGLYRCEVSAEAPSFASAQNEGYLEIISFAKENPIITAVERQYRIGDEINLNCTSGKSHPASILHWYINDKQVTGKDALKHFPAIQHRHGLITTVLGLRFVLNARHFFDGTMRVKCTATVSPKMRTRDRIASNGGGGSGGGNGASSSNDGAAAAAAATHNVPFYETRDALLLVHSGGERHGGSATLATIACFLVYLLSRTGGLTTNALRRD